MGEEVFCVEDMNMICSSSGISQCRICHEEEVESSKSLEVPCACSGTVKFAHRDCIQRWCNEKGNTTCEICLQKFEPGYTAPPKKHQQADVAVTIRGSLEVPRQERQLHDHSPGLIAIVAPETDYTECSVAADRSASCCRSVALTFTILLLARHFLSVLMGGTDHYVFTILTVCILRAGGVVLPLYILIRIVAAIQNNLQQQQHNYEIDYDSSPFQEDDEDEDDDELEDEDVDLEAQSQHWAQRVQIHS